jgi:flagellar protein FlaG
MSMEIAGINNERGLSRGLIPGESLASRMPTLAEQASHLAEKNLAAEPKTDAPLETLVRELQIVASALNRRLQFVIDQELDEVVVKVIDRQTDKVIKELPPREIQRLHLRIREAIGLLIDEQI